MCAERRRASLLPALVLLAGSAVAQAREPRPALPGPARLTAWVDSLCAPAMAGRRAGSPGGRLAVELVAAEFCLAGLEPAGAQGSFLQPFAVECGGEPATTHNVLGLLRGRGPLAEEVVILCAHHDHLGDGGPESRWSGPPRIHPGADDNASGVAALLGLAHGLARVRDQLGRSILFAAWGAEELGGLGAHCWLARSPIAPERIVCLVNLDMVGSSRGRLIVAGTASGKGLAEALPGLAGGLELALQAASFGGSDHQAFLAQGIPAVHLFTGAGEHYHTPLDTPDRIDGPGLAQVAAFAARLALHLSAASSRPAFDPAGRVDPARLAPAGPRPSLGTVPDFAQTRGGYRVARVQPGSPAEQAGLRAGDLLVELAGEPVDGFADFAALLFRHTPGQKVQGVVLRAGERVPFEATLAAAASRPAR